MDSLDWASNALPLKPGRVFSTYMAQSKEQFWEFLKKFHDIWKNT